MDDGNGSESVCVPIVGLFVAADVSRLIASCVCGQDRDSSFVRQFERVRVCVFVLYVDVRICAYMFRDEFPDEINCEKCAIMCVDNKTCVRQFIVRLLLIKRPNDAFQFDLEQPANKSYANEE